MEDTLLRMTEKSVHRFVDSICDFLPIGCVIHNSCEVTNTYYTAEQIKALGAPKPKFPLFLIDLTLDENDQPAFSHSPSDVVHSILKTFDHGLSALQEISQLEQKLLPNLFKSNQKSYLKVPVKPSGLPEDIDKSNKKLLPDPNGWIWHAYAKLRNKIAECVEPLDNYIATYDKYKAEYALDPVEYIKKMDDEENPAEPEALRKDVMFHRKEAERLNDEIPDSIVVSMFTVKCDSIRKMLVAKHT